MIATTEGYEDTTVLDAVSGAPRCVFHANDNTAMEFSPDGVHVAFADRDNTARLGDVTTARAARSTRTRTG